MKNCGCHMCRLAGSDCDERHDASDLVRARFINGWYYWGRKKNQARGRWVKICVYCIENMDGDCDTATLNAHFGI